MTTPVPTSGNSAQNGPAPGFARALIPVAVIVALAVGGLLVVRSIQGGPAARNANGAISRTGDSPTGGAADMRVGATLPDFQLYPFKGSSGIPASSLKSKVTMINFWATWCEACMVEMPSIIKLFQSYKDRGFDVAAIDLDSNPETVLPRTIQKFGMPFTIYIDHESQMADLFNIQAIPLTVVIDHDRKILMIENEGLDWNGQEFRTALEKWLAG